MHLKFFGVTVLRRLGGKFLIAILAVALCSTFLIDQIGSESRNNWGPITSWGAVVFGLIGVVTAWGYGRTNCAKWIGRLAVGRYHWISVTSLVLFSLVWYWQLPQRWPLDIRTMIVVALLTLGVELFFRVWLLGILLEALSEQTHGKVLASLLVGCLLGLVYSPVSPLVSGITWRFLLTLITVGAPYILPLLVFLDTTSIGPYDTGLSTALLAVVLMFAVLSALPGSASPHDRLAAPGVSES